MKEKPSLFNFLALLFMVIAISFPIQVALLYELSWREFPLAFQRLTSFNWILIGILLGSSILAFKASGYLKIALPLCIISTGLNNWVVSLVGDNYSTTETFMATIAFSFASSTVLFTKALDVILNPSPRFCWWKVGPRHQKPLSVQLKAKEPGKVINLETYDISKSGAFLNASQYGASLNTGETITLSIQTKLGEVHSKAKVVRKTKAHGSYPEGIGVQFEKMNLKNKWNLHRFLRAPESVLAL